MLLVLLIWLDAANVLSVPWWAYLLFIIFGTRFSFTSKD